MSTHVRSSTCMYMYLCCISDFVLVYEEEMDQQMKTASPEKGTMEQQRAKFLENLRKAGLEMEEVKTDSSCPNLPFR